MGISLLTPMSQIDKAFASAIVNYENKLTDTLQYIGEVCVREARQKGSYKDQTKNLRNSIGYSVLKNGQTISENSGNEFSTNFLNELKSSHNKGIALIVVAGMNYAAYVSAKGYDVLDSAELTAEKLVPQMLKKLSI